jgi:hypothetical protein
MTAKAYGTQTCVMLIAAVLASALTSRAQAAERQKISPTIVPNFTAPDLSAANNAYKLTTAEQALDCKKLTGHMQIRIRQLRSTMADPKTSEIGRTMQKVVTPLLAGTTRGIDQDGDNARDLGMLKAYNAQLATKKCQTFDLNAQLAPGNTEPPRPIPKPKAAAAPIILKAAPKAP